MQVASISLLFSSCSSSSFPLLSSVGRWPPRSAHGFSGLEECPAKKKILLVPQVTTTECKQSRVLLCLIKLLHLRARVCVFVCLCGCGESAWQGATKVEEEEK